MINLEFELAHVGPFRPVSVGSPTRPSVRASFNPPQRPLWSRAHPVDTFRITGAVRAHRHSRHAVPDRMSTNFNMQPSLRWRGLWLALGWAIAAGIVWLSLMPSPPK